MSSSVLTKAVNDIPKAFAKRVDEWRQRIKGCDFYILDYEEAMNMADAGDLIYCDPPYSCSQGILYGAQEFSLENLFRIINECKSRGVHVALSIKEKCSFMNFMQRPYHAVLRNISRH